ncbi:MAG TPA: ATP-binding protein [Candidatus Borkfalkia excrementigallinarum]|uniref:ATP-binding protein n=1 Tax=Candidatus Borkfalkia excrementigallinarum TaxID=2838506 RepID=A0A9D1ZWZ5_9FIRM|nr:ATP-binding protein [Candidatus Borkfalkia excrementigallinarum]
MATLHMMVGLPGSGKTTEAKKLEQQYNALRLTPDEWQHFLFGHDINDSEHDKRHTKIEELMWEVAVKVLKAGCDVILDFGFWTKSERDEFRQKARSFGADSKIHYMDTPNDVIRKRLEARNQSAGENAVFYVGRKEFDEWSNLFEIPAKEELE